MKSGTATKILLEVIFAVVFNQVSSFPLCPSKDGSSLEADTIEEKIQLLFECYEKVYRSTYLNLDEIAPLIEMAGNSLRGSM